MVFATKLWHWCVWSSYGVYFVHAIVPLALPTSGLPTDQGAELNGCSSEATR
jgi:hypothetical protein